MPRHTNQPTTFSYFVIAVDYGRIGVEAIVNPEITKLGAIAKVREILGDGNEIAFAHFISMNEVPEDVKDELIAAATVEPATMCEILAAAVNRHAARFDRARDLRKHEAV